MKDPAKKRYLYLMLSIFGAISLSIVVFFLLYRFQGVGDVFHKLKDILAPFIYGGVVAYLLRPVCNFYEKYLLQYLPEKMHKTGRTLSIALSLATGILAVYAVIIMIAPELYNSILSLWTTLPSKINAFLEWARATFGENENIVQLLHMFDTSASTMYQDLERWVSETIAPYISSIVSGVGSSVTKILQFQHMQGCLSFCFVSIMLCRCGKQMFGQGLIFANSYLRSA